MKNNIQLPFILVTLVLLISAIYYEVNLLIILSLVISLLLFTINYFKQNP